MSVELLNGTSNLTYILQGVLHLCYLRCSMVTYALISSLIGPSGDDWDYHTITISLFSSQDLIENTKNDKPEKHACRQAATFHRFKDIGGLFFVVLWHVWTSMTNVLWLILVSSEVEPQYFSTIWESVNPFSWEKRQQPLHALLSLLWPVLNRNRIWLWSALSLARLQCVICHMLRSLVPLWLLQSIQA